MRFFDGSVRYFSGPWSGKNTLDPPLILEQTELTEAVSLLAFARQAFDLSPVTRACHFISEAMADEDLFCPGCLIMRMNR